MKVYSPSTFRSTYSQMRSDSTQATTPLDTSSGELYRQRLTRKKVPSNDANGSKVLFCNSVRTYRFQKLNSKPQSASTTENIARMSLETVNNNFRFIQSELRDSGSLITDQGTVINQDFLLQYQKQSEFYSLIRGLRESTRQNEFLNKFPKIRVGNLEIAFTKVLGEGGTKVVLEGEVQSGPIQGTLIAVCIPSQDIKEVVALAELRKLGIGCNDFSELVIATSHQEGQSFPLMLMKPYDSHAFQVYDSKNMSAMYMNNLSIIPPLSVDIKDANGLLSLEFWRGMVDEVLYSFQKGVGHFGGDSLSFRKYPDGKWGFYILDTSTSNILEEGFNRDDLRDYATSYSGKIFDGFLQIAKTDFQQHPKLWALYSKNKASKQFQKQFADLVVRKSLAV